LIPKQLAQVSAYQNLGDKNELMPNTTFVKRQDLRTLFLCRVSINKYSEFGARQVRS